MRYAAILFLLSGLAHADFTTGEQLSHNLSVCLEKKDAIAIAQAEREVNFAAASKLWMENDSCATVPVQGHRVGKVVHSVKVKREGEELTLRVVEIVNFRRQVLGYFLTTQPVHSGAI